MKSPDLAPARSMDLVALRLRAALGRLARSGDPVLAAAVADASTTPVLCALVVAVTAWGDVPDTADLGAPGDAFWDRVGEDGLRVPAAWLGAGGWPALWQRAARVRHRKRTALP